MASIDLDFDLLVQDSRRPWPVAPSSVHLVFGSPPYHGAKHKVDYDLYDYAPSLDQWLADLAAVTDQAYRALVAGGRLVVNVANSGRKPYLDLAGETARIFTRAGLTLRGQVIWDKGQHTAGTAWGSWHLASAPFLRDCHEYLVIGQKGDKLDLTGWPARDDWQPGEFESLTLAIWRVQPESAKRAGHPAPFPAELARRVIRLYTCPGMTVLDPWAGSGTTIEAALLEGCHALGFDLSPAYIEKARARASSARVALARAAAGSETD